MMKRFKGFGGWRGFEKGSYVKSAASKITSPQCLPGLYSPARESSRRRSVDDSRFVKEVAELEAAGAEMAPVRYVARRRSVDDSRFRESEDLHAVRREIWRLGGGMVPEGVSSSESFSSDALSSSRPSDASVEAVQQQLRGVRATVVGFDANAREVGVSATVAWAFRSVLRRGDMLVLVGVMDYVRGPLGYKVQVGDQTWLGANKQDVHDEVRLRSLAWQGLPGLRKRCEDAGVRLVVDVKAAARAEVVIVQEAVAVGAAHVVLDRSLHNRRRRYYLERLSCDVTRMRRSGGVDSIRSFASIASDREKASRMPSPTSVLSGHRVIPLRPPRVTATPASSPAGERHSDAQSSSSLSRLVEETHVVSSPPSSTPTVDEADELFSIDHAFMARRVNMLLAPPPDQLADHRRDQLAMGDDQGYESDDLFSLAGDGASRRPSVAVFCPPDLQSARSSITAAHSTHDFPRPNLDSGRRLDKRPTVTISNTEPSNTSS